MTDKVKDLIKRIKDEKDKKKKQPRKERFTWNEGDIVIIEEGKKEER